MDGIFIQKRFGLCRWILLGSGILLTILFSFVLFADDAMSPEDKAGCRIILVLSLVIVVLCLISRRFNRGAFLPNMLKNPALLSILDRNFYISDIPVNVFTEITSALHREIGTDQPLRELNISSCFLRTLSEAARSHHSGIPQKETDLVSLVKAYIDDNIDADLSLDILASKFFVNPSYLSRCFKKKTNIHLSQYIAEKRIQYSLHVMVTQHGLPINEVARMSGFSGITTFNRTFKNIMHCTPGSFKKNACGFKI